jgi:hypothetical protein
VFSKDHKGTWKIGGHVFLGKIDESKSMLNVCRVGDLNAARGRHSDK